VVLEGPTSAGMIVITAQRGGTYARPLNGEGIRARPRPATWPKRAAGRDRGGEAKVDHARSGSLDELKEHYLGDLRDAVRATRWQGYPAGARGSTSASSSTSRNQVAHAHRESARSEDPVSDTSGRRSPRLSKPSAKARHGRLVDLYPRAGELTSLSSASPDSHLYRSQRRTGKGIQADHLTGVSWRDGCDT